ncbi:MAG TPA: PhoU domain-containing protein, partial [Thermoguttaceae bacterium]
VPFDMSAMWAASQAMLRESIDAMVYLDVPLAESVCSRDNKVDLMKHEVREKIEELVKKNPGYVPDLLRLLAVSRNLERIADCATNIAEDVIYLVEGRIVRHINEHF